MINPSTGWIPFDSNAYNSGLQTVGSGGTGGWEWGEQADALILRGCMRS